MNMFSCPSEPSSVTWQEFLGEHYSMFIDSAYEHFCGSMVWMTEGDKDGLLGRPPPSMESSEIWQIFLSDFRSRMHRIVAAPQDQHHLFACVLIGGMFSKNFSRKQMQAGADHLRLLFADYDKYTKRYVSKWCFPDGHIASGGFIVFSESGTDVAVARISYKHSAACCTLDIVQGIKGKCVDLLSVTDSMVASFMPLEEAHWEIRLNNNKKGVYGMIAAQYGRNLSDGDDEHCILDIGKDRVRDLLQLDAKKILNRHREYMFE